MPPPTAGPTAKLKDREGQRGRLCGVLALHPSPRRQRLLDRSRWVGARLDSRRAEQARQIDLQRRGQSTEHSKAGVAYASLYLGLIGSVDACLMSQRLLREALSCTQSADPRGKQLALGIEQRIGG